MQEPKKINYYVINLDRMTERWATSQAAFSRVGIQPARFSAIDISCADKLSAVPRICFSRYRRLTGFPPTPGHIGCYASHMEIWRIFLESDADYAVIFEDDALPEADFPQVLREALRYDHTWDLLRLFQENARHEVPYAQLSETRRLSTMIKGFISTAAYVINRRAARVLRKKLAVMTAPIDLSIHRGWYAVREATVVPWPVRLSTLAAQSAVAPAESFKKVPRHNILWWTRKACRFHSSCVRLFYQQSRRIRRWLFPPVPQPEGDTANE